MDETNKAQKRGRPFEKGNNANPGGRYRLREDVKEMLLELTPAVVRVWADALKAERPVVVGNGPHATVEMVPDHDVRIKAGEKIMNRIHGTPSQEVTGTDGGPLFGAFVPDAMEALKKLSGE
jgi:hypothetical protein